MPAVSTATSTWCGPGSGFGCSAQTSSAPGRMVTACMSAVVTMGEPAPARRAAAAHAPEDHAGHHTDEQAPDHDPDEARMTGAGEVVHRDRLGVLHHEDDHESEHDERSDD